MHLNQTKCVNDLLVKVGLSDSTCADTLISFGKTFNHYDGLSLEDPSQYWSVIGAL